jgi:hypothetical protein
VKRVRGDIPAAHNHQKPHKRRWSFRGWRAVYVAHPACGADTGQCRMHRPVFDGWVTPDGRLDRFGFESASGKA